MSLPFEAILAQAPSRLHGRKARAPTGQAARAYRAIMRIANLIVVWDAQSFDPATLSDVTSLPFLPVSLFKTLKLQSVPDSDIVKTMTSSGTTGQQSLVYLDKVTASYQQTW
jgi:phenylacetate-coenzyme A ligase PaaK-like adenylate-forming protein